MGVNTVNDAGSAYGAAFRNKPIFFMTGKETEAFFDGKMRRNMELREDTCTLWGVLRGGQRFCGGYGRTGWPADATVLWKYVFRYV